MEKQPNKEYQPLFYMQTLDGEQLGCSTANTFAFLHDDPKYDHIFYLVEADAEDEHDYGHYFWRNSIPEFDKLVEFMDTNGFYVEIGNDPAEVDVHQYLEDNHNYGGLLSDILSLAVVVLGFAIISYLMLNAI